MARLKRLYQSDGLREIWPSALDPKLASGRISLSKVDIVVLPLDRVGAPPGLSGASVYVAYYAHRVRDATKRMPSHPVVVKIGQYEKLSEEIEGAKKWPVLTTQARTKFAFPLQLDNDDPERAVLIAPFQSHSEAGLDGSRNKIEVRDLWRLLEHREEPNPAYFTDWPKIGRLVAEALDAVQHPHRAGRANPKAEATNYFEQYEWYLRGTTTDFAKHIPVLLFGTSDTTRAFGREWPNPTEVVHEISNRRLPFSGILGAVHGDLHPKNIVLASYDSVNIIDFGWATHPRHIVADYVLLDLNLRGTTLPSQICEADILALARFLRPEDDVNSLPLPVRERAKIIKEVIWAKAKARAVEIDWTAEYLIPLLLVGYGLLVHLDAARNQPALIATVLHLSELVRTRLTAGGAA